MGGRKRGAWRTDGSLRNCEGEDACAIASTLISAILESSTPEYPRAIKECRDHFVHLEKNLARLVPAQAL